MFTYFKGKIQKFKLKHKFIFNDNTFFYKMNTFNYSRPNIEKKEKFSYHQIERIINNLLSQEFRHIEKLPVEFHDHGNLLITLEKPTEPEEYECCGKGCNPCVWDRYDTKVKDFENTIEFLYNKLNED
jgi:hypothetical protein